LYKREYSPIEGIQDYLQLLFKRFFY
jgi:hypothetical protein